MSANLFTKIFRAIRFVVWVAVTFIGAQFIVSYLSSILVVVFPLLKTVNVSVYTTIYAALSYTLAVVLAIGVPWWLGRRTSKRELGVARPPLWSDIGLGMLGYIAYFILSLVVSGAIGLLLSGTHLNEAQDLPFNNLAQNFEFIVAFITLVVIAPFAEELLFRGYLLGKLQSFLPAWIAITISALAFGSMHLPGSTGLQWLVGIDTFVMGLVVGTLRVRTGNIWAGVLLHGIKNALAFYFLFINPVNLGML